MSSKYERYTLLFDPERNEYEQQIVDRIERLNGGSKMQEWCRKALLVGLAIENSSPLSFEMLATFAQKEGGGEISTEMLTSLLSSFNHMPESKPAPVKVKAKPEPKPVVEEQLELVEQQPQRKRIRRAY